MKKMINLLTTTMMRKKMMVFAMKKIKKIHMENKKRNSLKMKISCKMIT